MAQSQDVLVPFPKAAIFLVVTVRPGAEAAVGEVLADVADLKRAVGFRSPEGQLSCVVGIGSQLWDRLFAAVPKPAGLHPFRELVGDKHTAVSTPGDLLFHIRAQRADLCFELARLLMGRLSGMVDVADEVHGFRYFDVRDLMGFVDGTENPEGQDAADAVWIGAEDAAHAGGSYVIVQKYLHDLDTWDAISTEEQERVIGRTKLSDVELDDDTKPTNSHVALNTITDDDGNDLDIMRENMPFGSVGSAEFGTYFIGYSATPDVTEQMLENMFLGDPPGNYDRILDFSTAVTGTLFFVPTAGFLAEQQVSSIEEPSTTIPDEPPSDGSLAIGSLKRSEDS